MKQGSIDFNPLLGSDEGSQPSGGSFREVATTMLPYRDDSLSSALLTRSTHALSSSRRSALAREGASPCAVAFSIIKCIVGAGSFALPGAFLVGGLWRSVALTLFMVRPCCWKSP